MTRIVTYNVSGALDAAAVAEVLGSLDADIVCVLEAPGRFGLRRLARRCGLEVAVRAGTGRARVAVLVGGRVRRVSSDSYPLRELPGLPPRRVALALVSAGGRRLAVYAVQLGLRPEARSLWAGELIDHMDSIQGTPVVCADLNEGPGGPAGLRLTQRLVDAFDASGEGPGSTFPNPDPLVRKDYVLTDPSLPLGATWVAGDPPVGVASHHRPVVAEIVDDDPPPRAA